MNKNMTLNELTSQYIINHAIKNLKNCMNGKYDSLEVVSVEPSAQYPHLFRINYRLKGGKKTYVDLISMKDSLEYMLNGMNKALKNLCKG